MGEMASSVAHELNQPLTAITNYCNGMISRVRGDSIGRDDLVAALEKTARQAERAGQIIQRIRAFVRKSVPQRQAAQARQIVDDALELASIELRRRNVAIHSYVAQRLPELMVDPILIEQVLLNLIRNGAEAMAGQKDKRIEIACRAVGSRLVEVRVADSGPGLPPAIARNVFEPFNTSKTDGMGVGLAICRTIVESHGGSIRYQARGRGAAFFFTLRRAEPSVARAA